MIARLQDVMKRFGQVLALDMMTVHIEKGEILGLLGPNGAGKTTAIRALTGLIPVDSGKVEVFGKGLTRKDLEPKRRMGLVTQEITVFDDLSTWENLEFFGGLYGLRGKRLKEGIEKTLAFVGLSGFEKKRPAKFSGGMRRRLNIACSIVHDPEFLIMDEPTVGIDPQSRNHILESVRTLAAGGTTILYTSHYMEEVEAIASRVAVMDQGRVIAQGTVDELVGKIQYEEKIHLEVANPSKELEDRIKAIGGVKSASIRGRNVSVVSEAGSQNLDRIIAASQGAGGILSIRAEKPSLEDVFLTLTGKKLRDEQEETK